MNSVTVQLSKLGLIKKSKEGFIKGEQYSEIFNFMKKNFSDSATRRVAWAVWHLYSKGAEKFTTQQVLELLSYSDEEYMEELKHLQLVNKIYSTQKPILVKDLPERLFTAILNLPGKGPSEYEIIQKARELEKKSIDRALKKTEIKL